MCVRARVVTPLHEDEKWMIQALAFLSPVPWLLAPASSREDRTRRWALHHLQSKMPCGEKCTMKVTFHDVTVDTTAVEVDEQPVLTDHIQTDETRRRLIDTTFTEIPRGNSAVSRVSCLRLSFHCQRAQSQHLSSQSWHPRIDPPLVGHS